MYKPLNMTRFGTVTGWLTLVSFFQCGCEKTEPVLSYQVPKHETLQSSEFLVDYEKNHPKPERMIGLVLPRGSMLWFFKLQGNMEAIAAREGAVRDFLKSVTFTQDDKPAWTLPPGWRELPGNEMRHATLVLEGTPELELAVSALSFRPNISLEEQVVMNINRWRGQLSLPPIDDVDLDDQSEKIPVAEGTAYWINIYGRPKPKPAGMPPVASQSGKKETRTEPSNASSSSTLAFDKPETWVEGPPTQFAALSLRVADGDQKASVTVTPAGGNKLLNVNRWQGQVGLEPWSEEELTSNKKKVEVGRFTGELYEMIAGDRAILGVIVEEQGQTWFVKMTGDTPLVERERGRFEGFLKSLQLKN